MSSAVIIDVIVGAVLLGFAICGARRGLVRSVAGLVIVLIALAGAGILTNTLTPKVSTYLQPLIEKRVEARMDKALSGDDGADSSAATSQDGESHSHSGVEMPEAAVQPDTGETTIPTDPDAGQQDESALPQLDAGQLLKLLGIDSDPSKSLEEAAREKVRDTGVSIATAVVESVAESVLHILIFALSFALLLLLLKLAVRALDLVAKLPGLHLLNRLGGMAFGLVEGALALFLAVFLLRRLGVSFDTDAVEATVLLSFFTTYTPLEVLSFL